MLRRSSRSATGASERMENAARKCRVKKSIEKAQQEEAFKEFVAIIGANGGNTIWRSRKISKSLS
jgi:hypothetical protein